MTVLDDDSRGTPLPALPPLPEAAADGHPVYAALLGELAERARSPEPVLARYEDSP
ncbi:hypothetical protein HUT18_24790 [Streptomyces sp. NA04227]|uniref:hypothetical protein n=1 Tax=Streptomyces sp. NA04227 TaxID=2742136 RepID=UPI0015915D6F|nr:hypothetical protein [Streptomyces sp. NA04227]QKW09120.1 hypothetical protein HUT18_24790 [Streptomyces sp. NA04227]